MATLLPTVPYGVFCVFEPISTFAGFWYAIFQSEKFVAEQLPDTDVAALTPTGTLLAWQTGNLFGIMSMMAIAVLWSTSEVTVVRRYLVALLLGDIGHLIAIWWFMGSAEFFGVHQWNILTWANVGITFMLAFTRIGTLLEIFGPIGPQGTDKVKKT